MVNKKSLATFVRTLGNQVIAGFKHFLNNVKVGGDLIISPNSLGTPATNVLTVDGSGVVKTATAFTGISVDSVSKVKHEVKAGVPITKGQAVYVTGADGTNMIVGLASNASEATSTKTMGLSESTLATNGKGNVVTEGLLDGLDTTAATIGDPVWLGTGGNLIYGLANKPYAPAHLVFIGIVTRVNANNGEIFVKVQNGFELNEIHDVDLKTNVPVNGEILGFNGTLWVNKTIAGWLGYTPANASGTTNYVSKFTGTTTLGNSQIFDNGTNVGIGTATPSYKLDINGTFRSNAFFTLSNGVSYWGPNGSEYGYLTWDSGYAKVAASNTNTLYLGASNQITILSGGNVGIGTTSPVAKLTTITNAAGWAGWIENQDTTGNGSGLVITGGSNAGGISLLVRKQDGTSTMTVRGDGNVGIGTTTPLLTNAGRGNLTIEGSSQSILTLGVGGAWKSYLYTNGTNTYVASSGDLFFSPGGGYDQMIVTSGGNVGIGTTSPGYKLEVSGTVANLNNLIYSGGSLFLRNPSNTFDWAFYHDSSNNLRIDFNGASRLTVNSSGNVGIGTTSPSQKLDVSGYITSQRYYPYSSASTYIAGDTGGLTVEGSGYFYVFPSAGSYFQGIARFRGGISNDTASYLQINGGSSNVTYFNGTVGIGTTSPDVKFQVQGGAVKATTSNYASPSTGGAISVFQDSNDYGTIWAVKNYNGAWADIAISPSGGNVGIGTTSPGSYKLRVDGGQFGTLLKGGDLGTGSDVVRMLKSDNSVAMLVRGDGNIGINTTSPAFKLDISGGTRSNEFVFPQTAFNPSAAARSTTSAMSIKMWQNYFSGTGLGWDYGTVLEYYSLDGHVDSQVYFDASGGSWYRTAPYASNFGSWQKYITSLDISGTTNYVSKFTSANTIGNSQIFDNGTNVGIGTTSPGSKLHVNGGFIRVEGSSVDQYFLEGVRTGGATTLRIYDNSSVPFYDSYSSMYFRANQNGGSGGIIGLFGGNVGINTTSPATRLHVDASGHAMVVSNDTGNRRIYFGTGGTGEPDIQATLSNGTARQLSINAAGGNVGIGTISPNATLEVDGSFNVKNGNGNVTHFNYVDGSTNYIRGVTYFDTNSAYFTGGNVGIGTTSPSEKLEVVGTTRSTTFLSTNATGSTGLQITSNTASGSGAVIRLTRDAADRQVYQSFEADQLYLGVPASNTTLAEIGTKGSVDLRFATAYSERMRITAAGNVGIGTTSPYGRLELSGSGQSWTTAPAIRMWDSFNSKGWLIGNVNNITAGDFYIRTLPSVSGDPGSGQQEFTIKHATGNVGIGTTSPATKLVVNGGGFAVQGDSTPPSSGYGLEIWNSSTTSYIGSYNRTTSAYRNTFLFANDTIFENGGAERMRITAAGNVGIGTTSPGQKLSVEGGSIQLNANNAASNYYLILNKKSGQDGGVLFNRDNSGDWQLSNNASSGDLIFYSYGTSSEAITFKKASGNVGIGTTSPGAKLEIAGTTSTLALSFGNSVPNNPLFINTYGGFTGIGMDQTTAGLRLVGDFGGNDLVDVGYYSSNVVAHANWVSRMCVLGSGNVGIGTTSPNEKLNVVGNISVGTPTGSKIGFNTTDAFSAYSTSVAHYGISYGGGANLAALSGYFGLGFFTVGTEQMRITSGGNVGIGTTSPGYRLQTEGDMVSSGGGNTRTIGFNFFNSLKYNFYVDGTSDSDKLLIRKGTTNVAAFDTNGNFGIGTTSPSEKLDVVGVIRGLMPSDPGAGTTTAKILSYSPSPYGLVFRGYDFGTHSIQVQRESNNSAVFPLSLQPLGGNVGIGTTSPGASLHVAGAINSTPTGDGFLAGIQSGYAVIHLNGSAATGSLIDFSVSGTDTKGRILYDNINNYFGFNTNGAERLKITSTGDVGIGTSSPSAKLHVIGNATVSATLSTANAKISGTLADSFNQVGTAGQVLSSTGTGIEWITGGGGGGGSTIAVKDEGVSIGSSFSTLDFQGNNIQATASGSTAVITAFNNAGTGSGFGNATSTNYVPGATFGDVEIDSSIIFAVSPDAATGSSKLIATITFGVENVSFYSDFNDFEFQLYDVSQSMVVPNTTHTWSGYMNKNEGATRTVFTFHIPLDTDVAPGDEIRVQAKQSVSYTPEIYFCAITLLEGTT